MLKPRNREMKSARSLFSIMFGVILVVMLFALPGQAQVRIGLKVDHRIVMEGEPTVATIVIQNDSDAPLVFNEIYHNAELEVSIRRDRGSREPTYEKLDRDFVIMPDDRTTELVELTSFGDIRDPGSYQIWAQVRHDGRIFASRPQGFDVVHGIEMDSRERQLRGYRNSRLTYSLRYCARDGAEYAFLVVRDVVRGVSYGTFQLGNLVRIGKPAMNFDDKGRLVVAHQSGRNRWTRSVIAVHRDGAAFEEQTHHLPDGSPILSATPRAPEK
ncbi:MAG: hypothetical protein HN341_11820 [Verrucomicrobia bacterium]|jgi:hypothetical protein|nr:hypothetical protein [Verrucomicrobiota bacterium]